MSPLDGVEMICGCKLGTRCHGLIIKDIFDETFINGHKDDLVELKLDAMDVATAMEAFDEDDEEGIIADATDVVVLLARPAFSFFLF